MLLKQGCNEILRPDMLTALYNTYMWSQVTSDRVGGGECRPSALSSLCCHWLPLPTPAHAAFSQEVM